MSLDYKTPPFVVATEPGNNEANVSVNTQIKIKFSSDMDPLSFHGAVIVLDNFANRIMGSIEYSNRILTFTPYQKLSPNTTYQVVVVGDNDPDDQVVNGVRNILGISMAGTFTFFFTTARSETLPAPVILFPNDRCVIKPEEVRFEWQPVARAVKYELVVSKSNTLFPLYWLLPGETITGTSAIPNKVFEDGIYYWRIRAIGENNEAGEWSRVYTFNVNVVGEATVTPDDTIYPDPVYDTQPGQPQDGIVTLPPGVEILEVFPEEDFDNVATNIKTIYLRTTQQLMPNEVAIKITKQSIDNEYDRPIEIAYFVTNVVQDVDGTYLVTATLKSYDDSKPEVKSIVPVDSNSLTVSFSKPMLSCDPQDNEHSALNTENYIIDGLSVLNVVRIDDYTYTVITDTQTNLLYTIRITNIQDQYGLLIDDTTKIFTGIGS